MRKAIALLAASLLAAAALERPAVADVSANIFYDSLQPYGDWMQTTEYGYVWHPRDAAENWRPYTHGNWAYTDAGWTFVSDEPFGWATYHYGRWISLADTGWVWIPGQDWAPAWVSWRSGDKYVGWAPLPPEATFVEGVGIQGWADSYYDIGPAAYSFVQLGQFGAPQLDTVLVQPNENVTIINETRNITNITYNNNTVFAGGPDYAVLSRGTAQPIRRLKLERQQDVTFQPGKAESLRASVEGGTLRVPAPRVNLAAQATPPKGARSLGNVQADHGWKGVAQAEQLRAQIRKSAPKQPAGLPAQPKFEKANAPTAGSKSNEANPSATAASEPTPANNGTKEREPVPTRPANATSGRETKPPVVGAPKEPNSGENNASAPRKGATSPEERPGAPKGSNEPGLTPPGRNGSESPELRQKGNAKGANEPAVKPPEHNAPAETPEARVRSPKESRPEAVAESNRVRNGEAKVAPPETNPGAERAKEAPRGDRPEAAVEHARPSPQTSAETTRDHPEKKGEKPADGGADR